MNKSSKNLKRQRYLKCKPDNCVFGTIPDNNTVFCTAACKCGTVNHADE